MYSVCNYGEMIADEHRMDAYVSALEQAVREGSVVMDIGSGTGIFALLACKMGAAKVYAVETGDVVELASKAAEQNGFGDRIEIIHKPSREVELPVKADVMVSDLRGVLPFNGEHIPDMVDARRRFLAPGGALIPGRDTMWAALVDAPELYARYAGPWQNNRYDFDMGAEKQAALNSWYRERISPDQLLVEARQLFEIDYRTVEDPDMSAGLEWTLEQKGRAHGIMVWFDAVLADGISFSNAPSEPELIYGSAFFPWLEAVDLEPGDRVSVDLEARLVGWDYVWRWETRVLQAGAEDREKAVFKQSTFLGSPISPSRLKKRALGHVPEPNEDGLIARHVLESMGRGVTVEEISRGLAERFPSRFSDWNDALTLVGRFSERYSI